MRASSFARPLSAAVLEGTYQVSSSGLIEMMVRDADDPDSELEPEFLQLVDDAVLTDIVATRR
jgi:hypothetical protein